MIRWFAAVLSALALVGGAGTEVAQAQSPAPSALSSPPPAIRLAGSDVLSPINAAPTLAGNCLAPSHPLCCGAWHERGCRDCDGCFSLVGGIDVALLKPHFTHNPAYTVVETVGGVDRTDQHDFRWNHELAFSAWFGYVGPYGFGGRIHWRLFDDDADRRSVTVQPGQTIFGANSYLNGGLGSDIPGETMILNSSLYVAAWDFEMTQNLHFGCTSVVLAGGVRYAKVRQQFSTLLVDDADIVVGLQEGRHRFKGAGPTVAVEAYRSLGCSSLTLYGTGRVSLLYGDVDYQNFFEGRTDPSILEADVSSKTLLSVLEAEVGLEWSKQMGGSRMFGQLGLRGEAWLGGGNASNAAVDAIDGVKVTDFGLIGVVLRLGVDY